MTVYSRFAETMTQLAIAPAIIRTRHDDQVRHEVNGGSNGELLARVEAALVRVERQLAKVEKVTV